MKFLFVHQGFPGQYIHVINKLAENKNNLIIGLGLSDYKSNKENIKYIKYSLKRANGTGVHPWVLDLESKIIRGEACAEVAEELKEGFTPDIICGHPGWGELLFINKIWPDTPILEYQEFFYNEEKSDSDFDPEFQSENTWRTKARTLMKAVNPQLNLEVATWSVTPTKFQKSTFPEGKQHKISVIHDGIDMNIAKPASKIKQIELPNGEIINESTPVITFVNRRIEPYRGCHTFIRSIPLIQKKLKGCKVIIIGERKGVSYGAVCTEGGEWCDKFFKEIEGNYKPEDVHLVGSVSHESLIRLIQRSNAHVYLTYPFVLSWSLLEAMSCEAPIVASSTEPVMEVIEHQKNGLLVDFFDHSALSDSIEMIVNQKNLAKQLGINARQTIKERYSLDECVSDQIKLIEMVAKKIIK